MWKHTLPCYPQSMVPPGAVLLKQASLRSCFSESSAPFLLLPWNLKVNTLRRHRASDAGVSSQSLLGREQRVWWCQKGFEAWCPSWAAESTPHTQDVVSLHQGTSVHLGPYDLASWDQLGAVEENSCAVSASVWFSCPEWFPSLPSKNLL